MVNIPSYQLKIGDVVAIREKSRSLELFSDIKGGNSDWLEWNASQKSGRVLSLPQRTQIPESIKEQLIVELYSK